MLEAIRKGPGAVSPGLGPLAGELRPAPGRRHPERPPSSEPPSATPPRPWPSHLGGRRASWRSSERGWASLLRRASQDPNYRWSHGSPELPPSGMLALVADSRRSGQDLAWQGRRRSGRGAPLRRPDRAHHRPLRRRVGRGLVEYSWATAEGPLRHGDAEVPSSTSISAPRRQAVLHSPTEGTLMLDPPAGVAGDGGAYAGAAARFLDFRPLPDGRRGPDLVAKHGYRPGGSSLRHEQVPPAGRGAHHRPAPPSADALHRCADLPPRRLGLRSEAASQHHGWWWTPPAPWRVTRSSAPKRRWRPSSSRSPPRGAGGIGRLHSDYERWCPSADWVTTGSGCWRR